MAEEKPLSDGKIPTDESELYSKALEKWGTMSQVIIAIQEASEFIKALTDGYRNKEKIIHIAEEIADVEIMLEQLKVVFNNGKAVEEWKSKKLERLKERLGLT